ncbi:hypothetical protein ACIRRH_26195 [Kitasatospora sp. NPDC101235]|uniref:hypothetical protein n=1 Tax=Kitasatospora sp. NPDC101235 TaxID=3364101 RepID=UPI003801A526
MNNEIEKAAERVAKLRAQRDKVTAPLADAEAVLEAAEQAERSRRDERGADYDRAFLKTWREQAAERSDRGSELYDEFLEQLSAEPWFQAYAARRAERFKREKILTAAQNAQARLGEERTVPEQRWYDLPIIDDMARAVDAVAGQIASAFAEQLDAKRQAYIEATD